MGNEDGEREGPGQQGIEQVEGDGRNMTTIAGGGGKRKK